MYFDIRAQWFTEEKIALPYPQGSDICVGEESSFYSQEC